MNVEDTARMGIPGLTSDAHPDTVMATDQRPTSVIAGTSHIIPTRNRPSMALEAVESILAGEHLPAEIVVVDQSSEPNRQLQAMTERGGCQIRYAWTADRGLSRARNAGIRLAAYDTLSFTDDDCYVAPSWYGELVGALATAPGATVVMGSILRGEGAGFVPATVEAAEPAIYRGRIGTDVLGSNVALRRSAFQVVGLYDEQLGAGARFPSSEDNDLGYRLLEAGYTISYHPAAIVYHRPWRSSRHYLPLRWAYGRGQGAFYAKHASLSDRHMLHRFRRHVLRHVFRVPRRLIKWPTAALGDVAYVAGELSGFLEWLVRHRAPPNKRP